LVLLSFALVLVATVLLVLGLLNDDGLTLIYVSIASSVAAAVVLLVALRLNKPRLAEQRASGPAPLPEPVRPSRAAALPTPAVTPVAPEAQPATQPPVTASEEPALEPSAPAAASPAASDEWLATDQDAWPADEAWEEVDEVEFPIADYDSLTVGQILPLLPQLYVDEYDVVEERERAGQARPQVLAKLAELREGASTTASAGPSSDAAVGTDSVALDPLASYTEPATAGWEDDDWFPIEDYESLSAAQIRPLLPELDDEELSLVRAREMSLGRRRSLLDEIDRQLAVASPTAPTASAVSATKTTKAAKTTKRPAARKAPARKTPAKTAAAAKKNGVAKPASTASKATPAKKAPAKRATAAKAAATKNGSGRQTGVAKRVSPASKVTSASKPAAAKKTAPTRVAPVQKSASAKKAGAAGKAAAKKAAPAKKAPPAKKAAAAKRAPRA
jgi:hypothetical protein